MPNQSQDDVASTIKTYVHGVTTGDRTAVGSAFRDDAHMWGYLGDELVSMPISGFLDIVAAGPDPSDWVKDYRSQIRDIEVSGDVARAVLDETGYVGANFTNYFTLLCADGRWQIASKTFMLTEDSAPVAG